MRHPLFLAALICIACLGRAAAQSAAPKQARAQPEPWTDLNLRTSAFPVPIVIQAPMGAMVSPALPAGCTVTAGKISFLVDTAVSALGDQALPILRRAVPKADPGKFEKFVLEEPDGFIARFVGGRFLPVRLVKLGRTRYLFTLPRGKIMLPSEAAARQFYERAGRAR